MQLRRYLEILGPGAVTFSQLTGTLTLLEELCLGPGLLNAVLSNLPHTYDVMRQLWLELIGKAMALVRLLAVPLAW